MSSSDTDAAKKAAALKDANDKQAANKQMADAQALDAARQRQAAQKQGVKRARDGEPGGGEPEKRQRLAQGSPQEEMARNSDGDSLFYSSNFTKILSWLIKDMDEWRDEINAYAGNNPVKQLTARLGVLLTVAVGPVTLLPGGTFVVQKTGEALCTVNDCLVNWPSEKLENTAGAGIKWCVEGIKQFCGANIEPGYEERIKKALDSADHKKSDMSYLDNYAPKHDGTFDPADYVSPSANADNSSANRLSM